MAKKKTVKPPSSKPKVPTVPTKPTVPTVKSDVPFEALTNNPYGSGISQLLWVRADSLNANPKNWRKHPKRQADAVAANLKANGWAGVCIYNLTTQRLIDGHLRKELAGSDYVPVCVGNWTEEQERSLLMTLDPLAAMAETDSVMLKQLIEENEKTVEQLSTLSENDRQALSSLSNDLETHVEMLSFGESPSFLPASETLYSPEPEEKTLTQGNDRLPGAFQVKSPEEIGWDDWGPGSLLDIPIIHPDRTFKPERGITTYIGPKDSREAPQYLYIFGSYALDNLEGDKTVVAFYTWDANFEQVWTDATKFVSRCLNYGIKRVLTPNWSCFDGMHRAYDIWQTYRSRWIGRYWQECGLSVVPDIVLGNLIHEDTWQWRLAGIQKGMPCLAFQLQQKGDDVEPDVYYRSRKQRMERVLDTLKPQSVLIYHGNNLPEWFLRDLPGDPEIFKCRSFISERGDVIRNNKSLSR